MVTLLLCTRNSGKAAEMRALLPKAFDLVTLEQAGMLDDVPETGTTLEENALQKAHTAFAHTGLPSISDDSGLEVRYLNGAPGVLSARYAGDQNDPEQNISKLLRELHGVADRSACFRTVIAFVDASRSIIFHGSIQGNITTTSKGSKGFGYDPIFQPNGSELTFAAMDPTSKNIISHRGIAMRKLNDFLRETFLQK